MVLLRVATILTWMFTLALKVGADSNSRREFIHPGILQSREDITRMKLGVQLKQEPWYTAFLNMSGDPLASATYQMAGPMTYASRNATGSSPGKNQISHDSIASLLNALMFIITDDEAHAKKAVEILNGWANTLQILNGTDAQLTASLYGAQFVNAAELIRAYYAAWSATEIAKFKKMILDIFYPPVNQRTPTAIQPYPFLANWGLGSEAAMVAFGVFLDNRTMYEEGLDLYQTYGCANLSGTINPFGQQSESGRDQTHTQLGLGEMAELCQTAYNQGDSHYWDLLGDRLMTGYEYTAKYNLGYDVPYDKEFYRCGANLVGGPWTQISSKSRGYFRGVYQIAYAYYAQLRCKDMPYTKMVLEQHPIEWEDLPQNIGDSAVYGTLRFARLEGNPWTTRCPPDSGRRNKH